MASARRRWSRSSATTRYCSCTRAWRACSSVSLRSSFNSATSTDCPASSRSKATACCKPPRSSSTTARSRPVHRSQSGQAAASEAARTQLSPAAARSCPSSANTAALATRCLPSGWLVSVRWFWPPAACSAAQPHDRTGAKCNCCRGACARAAAQTRVLPRSDAVLRAGCV